MGDKQPPRNSNYVSGEFSIDENRPIKIVIVGAGFSGITAGIRFRQKIPNAEIRMYEALDGVGGTWRANRYPGIACDIPAHTYQLTFESNPNWSQYYAPGPEILEYLENVADKYKLTELYKFNHRLSHACWDQEEGKWHLRFVHTLPDKLNEYEEVEESCDVLYTGLGVLCRWNWPDIPGRDKFQGTIVHSAQWNTGEGDSQSRWEDTIQSWNQKTVGVIGVGSTAIQIVPALQPRVKKLLNFVKSQTWISGVFVTNSLLKLTNAPDADNYAFSEKDKQAFQDTEYYKEFRHSMEDELNSQAAYTIFGHPFAVGAQEYFKDMMTKRLAKKPWIAEHLIPSFAPGCRRLTPGPGYLEAICEDNVDFVSKGIKQITEKGIETIDGKHEDLDVIVFATGFDTSFNLGFPIIGQNGLKLEEKYTPHPRVYLGVAVDGFPNWFQCLGPNSGVGAGSLLILVEKQVDYACQAILKIQRERIKSMTVKKAAVDDWDEYIDSYFPRTVFGQKCRSWYKAGKTEDGAVIGLWPGSTLHGVRALEHPRWEDFDYEYIDKSQNRFHWLGDGTSVEDNDPKGDKAFYLRDDYVDIPPVPK